MNVIITANGSGERMKGITHLPKFSIFYKGKRILEHLLQSFPMAKVLTHWDIPYINKEQIIECCATSSRKKTLFNIKDMKDVLIVDCDIYIPKEVLFEINFLTVTPSTDIVFWKYSDREQTNIIPSGVYFVKSIEDLLDNMDKDEIPAIYHKPEHYLETVHLGTIDEYYSAILAD